MNNIEINNNEEIIENNNEEVIENNEENQLNEHEQKMIDRVENKTEETELPSEENKLAGKYESTDDLKKGIENLGGDLPEYVLNGMNDDALVQYYKELESNIGNKDNENKDTNENNTNEEINEEKAKEIVDEKGLDFDALTEEFTNSGELSEETYNKLKESGIPKEMVDGYIKGQEAILNQKAQEIYNTIGGETEYNSMIAWASENLSENEKVAFNDAINQSDSVASFTIQNLHSRYKSTQNGKIITGNQPVKINNSGYETRTDMNRDLNNPAYKKDAQFRNRVEQKIQKTNWI